MMMYHPDSKGDGVDVHPTKVEDMKLKGWKTEKTKSKPKKEISNGNP